MPYGDQLEGERLITPVKQGLCWQSHPVVGEQIEIMTEFSSAGE
jgi:hypothetical protein